MFIIIYVACIYVYIYIFIYLYIYICIFIYCIYMYTQVFVSNQRCEMCVYIYVCVCAFICISLHGYIISLRCPNRKDSGYPSAPLASAPFVGTQNRSLESCIASQTHAGNRRSGSLPLQDRSSKMSCFCSHILQAHASPLQGTRKSLQKTTASHGTCSEEAPG